MQFPLLELYWLQQHEIRGGILMHIIIFILLMALAAPGAFAENAQKNIERQRTEWLNAKVPEGINPADLSPDQLEHFFFQKEKNVNRWFSAQGDTLLKSLLTAKLQAVLRRSYGSKLTSHSIECGEVVLNLNDTSVAVRGEKIDLTKNEFLILKTLMEKQGKVVSREEIMERLWGNDEFVDDNTLTVNITRIRKKLEAAGVNDFITTKRGLGYLVGA